MSAADRKKVWYLRRIDLFASLATEEIEEVARLLDDRHISAGVELLGHRQHDQIFLVKDGVVRLHAGASRQQATFALLGRGRVFGLSSRIGDANPMIRATTLVPSYVCFATWPALGEVFHRYPSVMLKMMGALAEQVLRAETWRERFGATSPRHRLGRLLVDLSDEFGEPTAQGRRIRFHLTQADLARMIGLSRGTVSRLMAEFALLGWVTRNEGSLVVRDRAALLAPGEASADDLGGP